MDRRHFLQGGAALAALATSCVIAPSRLLARTGERVRVQSYQYCPDSETFLLNQPAIEDVADSPSVPMRVVLEHFRPAKKAGIDALSIQVAFDRGDGEHWRFLAWHYRRDAAIGGCRGGAFDVQDASICRLELRVDDRSEQDATLQARDLAAAGGAAAGRHVLTFSRGPMPVVVPFSGDWNQPLPEDLDHLVIRVEPLSSAPDLALRADLACEDGSKLCTPMVPA